MMREHTGEQIAKTKLTRNEEDKVKDERELMQMRQKEAVLKSIQAQKLSTRHSRFGGTFSVRDVKAPSGRDMLCHKPITSTADLSLDSTKKTKKTATNRLPMNELDPTRRSTIPVRLILKEFCSEFLDGAYNSIMHVVKDNINRGRMQDHDETYYLWAMKFFMEFNRFHKFRVSYVSETMSTTAFHYVQTLLDNYHGMMVTDKEKIPFWSKRAHMALNAYQELLFTLLWMDKYGNEGVKESSRVIKSNVFYLPEYRELCLGLLNSYDPVKLSKLYLKDLIETNHLFLKMLEECATSSRRIIVKTKGKKRKIRKSSSKSKKSRRGTKDSEELEEMWETVSEEISSSIESPQSMDEGLSVIPFDAASDVPIDEQKVTAMERIAVFLHTKKYNEAVALLRASREVWPESKEEFGEEGMDVADEISVLKSIFVEKASLPAVTTALRGKKLRVYSESLLNNLLPLLVQ
jgi:timeless